MRNEAGEIVENGKAKKDWYGDWKKSSKKKIQARAPR